MVRLRDHQEVNVDDMGLFLTDIAVENPVARGVRVTLTGALVDTGSELTWVPSAVLESLGVAREERSEFQMADGTVIARDIGYAIVHAGGKRTIDDVVFALPGDTLLLGARSIEGLNLRVDLLNKRFVAAGPISAAAAA